MLSVTANTRLLKKAVRASNAFISETRVRVSEKGIAVRAVDAGNICLTECLNSKNPLSCLLKLFKETDDGWVAFHIGNVLKDTGKLEEAIEYYKKAYERLPLPKYKEIARVEIEKLEKLVGRTNKNVLFIVSCTRKKIWGEKNAPKYVPAKEAYTGSTMRNWLKSKKAKKYP